MLRLFFSSIVNNFKVIMTFYIVSLLFMAFMFSDIESHSFVDSLYWATCTSLTIGYGDFSPHSDAMKILTVVFAHFWAFIVVPAVIIKFFMTFIQDRDEFTHEEQEEIKSQLWRIEILLNAIANPTRSKQSRTTSAEKKINSDNTLFDIIQQIEDSQQCFDPNKNDNVCKTTKYPPHVLDNPDFVLLH